MIFVRQQGEVLPSDFLISRQGAVGRDQPLNANSAAAVAGFLCLGISSDDPGATSGSRYEQGITRRVAVLHCVATVPSPLMLDTGAIIATTTDYAAVRELVADVFAEGIEATVPATVRGNRGRSFVAEEERGGARRARRETRIGQERH